MKWSIVEFMWMNCLWELFIREPFVRILNQWDFFIFKNISTIHYSLLNLHARKCSDVFQSSSALNCVMEVCNKGWVWPGFPWQKSVLDTEIETWCSTKSMDGKWRHRYLIFKVARVKPFWTSVGSSDSF